MQLTNKIIILLFNLNSIAQKTHNLKLQKHPADQSNSGIFTINYGIITYYM